MKFILMIYVFTTMLFAYEYKNYNSTEYNKVYKTDNTTNAKQFYNTSDITMNKPNSNIKKENKIKEKEKVFEKIPLMSFSDFKSRSNSETVKEYGFLDNYSYQNTLTNCVSNPSYYGVFEESNDKIYSKCECLSNIFDKSITNKEASMLIGIVYYKNLQITNLMNKEKGDFFGKSFNKEDNDLFNKLQKTRTKVFTECRK